MTPDDPRHGTPPGYHAGCRDACCMAARSRYEKGARFDRIMYGGRAIPAIGAQRRIRALMVLGWTSTDIAHAAGWGHRNYVRRIIEGQKGKPCTWVERKTDLAIRAVYDRLSMRLPERTPARARTATIARRHGWSPPLAWDDDTIDDPAARPHGHARAPKKQTVDLIAVERVLAGDRVPTTLAEKREVTRRWVAQGRSLNELERVTGWKSDRYTQREAS